jgi:hypothetical protein
MFTPGPAALHNKTYPLRIIIGALTDYHLGYSLAETAARLKKKTHRAVSPSTITAWLRQYRQHCSYRRLRAAGLARFPAEQTIRSIKLYHRQIYAYAYHRPKLEFVRAGTLDDKRAGGPTSTVRFASLANFLENIPTICPHDLFRRDDDPKSPRLTSAVSNLDVSRIIVNRSRTRRRDAALIIQPSATTSCVTRPRRVHAGQRQRLAIEIPIWLAETDIAALERQHVIELAPRW